MLVNMFVPKNMSDENQFSNEKTTSTKMGQNLSTTFFTNWKIIQLKLVLLF